MNNVLNLSSSIVRRINYVLINISNVILALLTLAVTADVIMRYVFSSPLLGVKQISEYAMVWLCFLSVGWVLRVRQHVAISLLENWIFSKTKSRKKKYYLFIDLICLFYTLPLLWLSMKEVWIEYTKRTILTGELGGVAAYLAHFCIPLGFLFLSLQLIINIAANILEIDFEEGVSGRE